MKLAMEDPVTNTPPAPSGIPNTGASQRRIWRSTSMGMWSRPPRLALSPAASISPSIPATEPPPCTQPMKPGCTLPVA